MTRRLFGALVLLGITIANGAGAGPYVAGGTVVYRTDGNTEQDRGAVLCSLSTGAGIGGACIPFAPAIGVTDAVTGNQVAFQVCIDNNGDSVCSDAGQEPTGEGCLDQMFFSHDDQGRFFNPLGPLPNAFARGCPGGPFRGYVVFVCEGVHKAPGTASPHVHPATTGTVGPEQDGTGFGTFCGGARGSVVEKPYRVVP